MSVIYPIFVSFIVFLLLSLTIVTIAGGLRLSIYLFNDFVADLLDFLILMKYKRDNKKDFLSLPKVHPDDEF